MDLEQTPKKQMRCWLTEEEQEYIVDYYEEDIEKQLALRLMLECGLRSEEVPRVSQADLEPSSAGYTKLKIPLAKRGFRTGVIPQELATQIRTIKSLKNLHKTDPVIKKSPRTIQRWVTNAAEDLADDLDDEDWHYVSAHDMRRTWASGLVQKNVPIPLVMSWGGWENYETFKKHYWRESEELVAQHLERIGIK
ncbi:tyrosine-type recombinase/integrase [Haloferax larsenii]|uniref:Phage integrase family protein n=1 Tax=Haloferax larsenii TaxID=302484 RepID=A0A1H7QQX9_HALLR|nr:tyrosine-type recombinase/integrase [Haloferax larsenii]SEL50025.1 Phage integrase family protein [Haloferax larsenii]